MNSPVAHSAARDAENPLAGQLRHQRRLTRKWMTWWIPWIFVIGLLVSILGLIPSVAELLAGAPTARLYVYALSTAFFGWAVGLWIISPRLIKPRIVPYFARELAPYGGSTMAAFKRGGALYQEIKTLEAVAAACGVKPLTAFGFAYDYYEQDVRWHPAAEGLGTVEALGRDLGGHLLTAPDLAADLDALAQVMRTASDQGVEFSLVLRLHAKDDMQTMSREVRQGSFW